MKAQSFYLVVRRPTRSLVRGKELWMEEQMLNEKDMVRWIAEFQTKPKDIHAILCIDLDNEIAEDATEDIVEQACEYYLHNNSGRNEDLEDWLYSIRRPRNA
jgi:hypothetical protein